ncbi:hypothetical protein [Sphingomonas corticis]|uniref:Uncharacterized protein n=1 Tax=Sphingomonas corticis TaxID=2722791 RepID=A0ABX1CQ25_9SPHN|nr:hypothetical protein [Sphingomonas corticis]NJR80054.1 hypothetical protein [Sphingomonas corticis]
MEFLCDGWAFRNPGVATPIVHDGSRFLRVRPSKPETNHRAIYDAIDRALGHAIKRRASAVSIEIVSSLVYEQITATGHCRLLRARRDKVRKSSSRVGTVTWRLVKPPFTTGSSTYASTRELRRKAPRRTSSWPLHVG